MYVCMYVYMCVYVCMHACMHALCMCTYVCVTRMCVHACVLVCVVYTCVFTCVHACIVLLHCVIFICIHICIWGIRIYTHWYVVPITFFIKKTSGAVNFPTGRRGNTAHKGESEQMDFTKGPWVRMMEDLDMSGMGGGGISYLGICGYW